MNRYDFWDSFADEGSHSGRAISVFKPRDERSGEQKETITGWRLLLALSIAVLVMSLAVFLGLELAFYGGSVWFGFLPLILGWLGLYPIFRRLSD